MCKELTMNNTWRENKRSDGVCDHMTALIDGVACGNVCHHYSNEWGAKEYFSWYVELPFVNKNKWQELEGRCDSLEGGKAIIDALLKHGIAEE
jgi:hypothetical protein